MIGRNRPSQSNPTACTARSSWYRVGLPATITPSGTSVTNFTLATNRRWKDQQTGEWKEEIVFHDVAKAAHLPGSAKLPDGSRVEIGRDDDPRVPFANWLVRAKNPWFARAIANRLWSWLMGVGVVQEPDDLRPDNPPSNPELLACLDELVVASRFQLKQVMRAILLSEAYQSSSKPSGAASASRDAFACYRVRRLEAELLIDAIDQIAGTGEAYSSQTPEPFTFIPESQRSTNLPDGSITSPFLETFGRPPRDSGYESERNNDPSAAQRLHLLNSSHILNKISKGSKLTAMFKGSGSPEELCERLFLTILSRKPTDRERKIALGHWTNASSRASTSSARWRPGCRNSSSTSSYCSGWSMR